MRERTFDCPLTVRMTARRITEVCTALALAMLAAGCDASKSAGPDRPVQFSVDVHPLLKTSCATSGCHNGISKAAGLSMESWEELLQGSENGAVVVAYRSVKSHLVQHMNTDSSVAPVAAPLMPPSGALPRTELEIIMRWIDEGAKNDNGIVPFSVAPEGRVYVTNQAEDQIAVIDRATNLVARLVPVGVLSDATSPPEAPHNVVVDPNGVYYYVNLIVASEIWKFRVSDDLPIGRLILPTGVSPAQVVLSSDGATGYFSNFDLSGNVRGIQAFSTSSMQMSKVITDSRAWASHGVQLTHSGEYLWTCNQISDNLMVVDLQTDAVSFVKIDPSVPDVPVASSPVFGPYQMVFTPDDAFAYVTCRTSNEVRVFDTSTRQLVATIPVGPVPLILDITPDGSTVFVANRGNAANPTTGVSVISTASRSVITTISGVHNEPHGVAVTPDGNYVYVTTENIDDPSVPHHPVVGGKTPSHVYIIDAHTYAILGEVEVGAFGAGVAVTQ